MTAILGHDSRVVLQARNIRRTILVQDAVPLGNPWCFYLDYHNITILLSVATPVNKVPIRSYLYSWIPESAD